MDLSEIFKALGDRNRLRIMNLISKQELCVCMIAKVLNTSQPNISKHLNKLRYSGIIKCRKISQWCFYSISGHFKNKYNILLEFFIYELKHDQQYCKDIQRLEYLLKTDTCCQQLLQE